MEIHIYVTPESLKYAHLYLGKCTLAISKKQKGLCLPGEQMGQGAPLQVLLITSPSSATALPVVSNMTPLVLDPL